MPGKKCIMFCTTTAACAPLHYLVAQQLAAAAALGYNGSTTADVFIAGHSLGGVCAGTLAAAYYQNTTEVASDDDNYAAVVVMGSYVDGSDVAAYPLPVLTLGAELDGGAGRPGVISESLASADGWAAARGEEGLDGDWQLQAAAVAILPGLDHSSFCPGFAVPGDVFPAEVGGIE